MGRLRFQDSFIGEAADAALSLFIEDTDTGAIGAENAVGQIRGQLLTLESAAATTAERSLRQGFGATEGADPHFQVAAAEGALHWRRPHLDKADKIKLRLLITENSRFVNEFKDQISPAESMRSRRAGPERATSLEPGSSHDTYEH
jgi:hypothetical protein